MKVEGRCHCGRISYEGDADPDSVAICHCTDCQALTGSAYRANIRVSAASFVIRGEPKIYIKTADSGSQRAHAFCPNCGSPVYSAAVKDPQVYSLRLGAIKQRTAFIPKRQIWVRSALPWAMDLNGFEKSERQ